VAKVPAEIAGRVDGHVTKYKKLLKIEGERPSIKFRDTPRADWLGLTDWRVAKPHASTMELQKKILKDDRLLERVVAHEMIHHRDFLGFTKDEIARVKAGIKPDGHGPSFREGAGRINAVMGSDFVVEAIRMPAKGMLVASASALALLLGVALLDRKQETRRVNERGNYGK